MIEIVTASEFDRHSKIRKIFSTRAGGDLAVTRQVERIMQRVKRGGDRALRELSWKFDGVRLQTLRVPLGEIEKQAKQAPTDLRRALAQAHRHIERFHRRQMEKSWTLSRGRGSTVGLRVSPINAVGLYVPGGVAAYPSTVLMNSIPARVAGVKRIAVATPPRTLAANPGIAAALVECGLDEVYGIGGAQAIAALAFGTESIRAVDKIVGPGNRYVATAKRLVFGTVDIDLIAGPSEVIIVADHTADARWIAADLLAQAEHDPQASAICVTASLKAAQRVQQEIETQIRSLERRAICRKSIDNFGAIIVTRNLSEAATIVNRLAPEHLELHLRHADAFSHKVNNAGAIFVGPFAPEAVGDYFAGPNHVLPTGGTARFSSPLGVYDFLKRTSIIRYSPGQLAKEARALMTLAGAEQLTGHARSVGLRMADERNTACK